MNELMEAGMRVVLIGVGATMVMDAWLILLRRVGVPTLDFALVGRWVGHLARGTWGHDAIAKAAPVKGERALGWLVHYVTGIAFAGLLVLFCGAAWTKAPSALPAVGIGLFTVVAPLFVMQPAMGAGIAASRTRTPVRNCLKSVANHTVFGVGLYVAAACIVTFTQ